MATNQADREFWAAQGDEVAPADRGEFPVAPYSEADMRWNLERLGELEDPGPFFVAADPRASEPTGELARHPAEAELMDALVWLDGAHACCDDDMGDAVVGHGVDDEYFDLAEAYRSGRPAGGW